MAYSLLPTTTGKINVFQLTNTQFCLSQVDSTQIRSTEIAFSSSVPFQQLVRIHSWIPHLNGIELCQVAPNQPRWSGLPVLFITAYTDANTVNQVFAVGYNESSTFGTSLH